MEGRALPEATENALRALFCEKNGFSMGVNGRGLGRFSFRPKSPQKGRGHLTHDFRLTARMLPDSDRKSVVEGKTGVQTCALPILGVNGRGLGRFSFRPKSPQKGRGHLTHDFRLTERLLPDSTMTYRGRSDAHMDNTDQYNIITFK